MNRVTLLPQLSKIRGCALRLKLSNGTLLALNKWATVTLAASIGCLGMQPTPSLAQAAADSAHLKGRASKSDGRASGASVPIRKDSGQSTKVAPADSPPESSWPERLVWDKTPLRIALGIGPDRERSITFPSPMHIGAPQEIATLLRLQTVGPTTYVTALAPFPRSRIIAEDRNTGAVILLDLSAAPENTSTQPITVVTAPNPATTALAKPDDERRPPVDMVTLTRFAAQQMYAPRRLAIAQPDIRRVNVDSAPLTGLYAGANLKATAAAQWRCADYYVTAVVLQNQQTQAVELDPGDVRGRWRAITFQHGRLLAKGSEADTTVAYLVCDRPFESCR